MLKNVLFKHIGIIFYKNVGSGYDFNGQYSFSKVRIQINAEKKFRVKNTKKIKIKSQEKLR